MKKILLIKFLFVILSFNITAQNTTEIVKNDNIKEIDYKPVPIIEIPQKIDEVNAFLKKINSLEIPAVEVDKLEKDFIEFQKEIEPLKKESSKKKLTKTTSKKLNDYNKKWGTHLEYLEIFKSKLEENSKRLDGEREQIKKILNFWEETYSNAKKEKAPKQLLNRLLQLKKNVTRTDKSIFAILTRVLTLRDKISVKEVEIKEIISIINSQIKEKRSLLFTFDSAPIWTALTDTTNSATFSESIASSTNRLQTSIEEFWDMYSEEFPYYISFFFLVLLITYYLKIFANKNVSDEIIDRNPFAINILSKPISISVLITIYFELAFFPLAPSAITEISRVLLVIPILFLFPTFISKPARGPLYFISGVYIIQQFVELTVGTSIYLRVFIILLTSMMFGGLIWFLKMDTNSVNSKKLKLVKQLQLIARLLIIILFISLIGNIIGNTALSTLIFYGVMRTINISLILITSLQVFYTLVTVLFETKYANISLLIKNRRQEIIRTIFSFAKFVALVFWIIKFLDNFEVYDSIKENLVVFLTTETQIGNITFTISNILLFFISIWIATKISKMTRFFIENEVFPRVILPRGVPAAISLMLNYTILTLGFLISLSFIGFDIEKLTIVIGALGVGIGFGLQNIVNNFISGLILLFERPIQVGDTISLTNLIGTVKRIGIRASIVQTFDGAEVIVPNADLISGQVINWTLSDSMRRIEIKIGVHFNADPGKVMDILNQGIEDEDEILKTPAPYILYHGLQKSTQNFVLRFWTANSGNWIFLRSNVLLKITKMLREAGIEIPYKQQNIYIKNQESRIIRR